MSPVGRTLVPVHRLEKLNNRRGPTLVFGGQADEERRYRRIAFSGTSGAWWLGDHGDGFGSSRSSGSTSMTSVLVKL